MSKWRRSWFPVLYSSIYLKTRWRSFYIGETSGGDFKLLRGLLMSKKVHCFPRANFVFFLATTCGGGAEEWRKTWNFVVTCLGRANEPQLYWYCFQLQKRCRILQTNRCMYLPSSLSVCRRNRSQRQRRMSSVYGIWFWGSRWYRIRFPLTGIFILVTNAFLNQIPGPVSRAQKRRKFSRAWLYPLSA